jgi:hypothetical protein
MTLTVGDIERWDPGALREVFAALGVRAEAVGDAVAELGRLRLASWFGEAAAGAAAAVDSLRRDLQAHAGEVSAVADAARRAADSVEDINSALRQVRTEAAAWRLDIDPVTGVIRPLAGAQPEALAVLPTLQARLYSIVDQANSVDGELATAFGFPVSPVVVPPGSVDLDNRRHLAQALARARDTNAANLADLQAIQDALDANPGTRLVLFDGGGGAQVHAAIAAGDPFTATHVSVTTPGLNTTLRGSIGAMTREAAELRREARRQLIAAGRGEQTVAAVAWLGYDAPQIPAFDGLPGLGGPGANAAGVNDVSHAAVADAAAAELARFYARIQAGRAVPAHLTAIGHSYGSLTTGLALQRSTDVADAVFYGSPGVRASTPAQLNLRPGHVFAMEAPDDPIQLVFDGPPAARVFGTALPWPHGFVAGVLSAAVDVLGAGEFGPNPATNPEFVRLETDAVAVPGGLLAGASGHSQYSETAAGPAGQALLRTTGYNIAAVVAGLGDNAIRDRR